MRKFVSLKPKSAQTCKHSILEYSSSVSYSSIEKGSSKPGNFAELGGKKQTDKWRSFLISLILGWGKRAIEDMQYYCATQKLVNTKTFLIYCDGTTIPLIRPDFSDKAFVPRR